MTRHFISHLPLRRNGSVWPGDEYATFRGMGRHVSPLFPIPHTSAFSWTCCSCCCCEVHTATTRNLKPPFRYTRQGGPRLCSHRGASASAVPPSFRRDTTLPACIYAFTIGEFQRWWYRSPPCSTSGGWRLIPTGLPLCLTLDAGVISTSSSRARPCSNILAHEAATGATFFFSRASVSPMQSAHTPGRSTNRWFSCLDCWSPTG